MTSNVIRLIINDIKEKFKDPINYVDIWDKQEMLKIITNSNFYRLKITLGFTLIVSSLLLLFDLIFHNNWSSYGILPLYVICDIMLFIVSVVGLLYIYKHNFINTHNKSKIVLFFILFGITWTGVISAPPTFESYFAFLFGTLLISGTFVLKFTYRILLVVLIYSIFCISRIATGVDLYTTVSDYALVPMELLLSVIVSTIVYKVKVENIYQKLQLTNKINTLEYNLSNSNSTIIKKTQQLKNQIEKNSQVNEQLYKSYELYDSILSQISETIIIIDNSLNIKEWNNTIENISGLTKKSVVNKNFLTIWSELLEKNSNYNENYNTIKQYLKKISIGLIPKQMELDHWIKTKDKSILLHIKFTPITLQNNLEILINCANFSYKHRYLEMLRDQKEEIALSNRHKSIFFEGIKNNILYPLRTTNNILQKIKQLTNDGLAHNYIEHIKNNHNKLNNSIEELIEYSEIESQNIKLSITTFSILQLQSAIEPLLINYNKKNITLINNFGDCTALIESDKLKLTQIFTNLINNALKFTEKGIIEYGFTISNNSFYGYVKDTGIGIHFYELEKIFEPFYHGNNTTKNNTNGLGLSIVKGYLDILEGNIIVKSNTNKGSTFEFDFPIKTVTPIIKKSKTSCIIVDNNNETYDLLHSIISKFYKQIFHTYDCESTTQLINTENIDLIIVQLFSKSTYSCDISKCLKQKITHQKIVAISFQPLDNDIISLTDNFDEVIHFNNQKEFTSKIKKLIDAK